MFECWRDCKRMKEKGVKEGTSSANWKNILTPHLGFFLDLPFDRLGKWWTWTWLCMVEYFLVPFCGLLCPISIYSDSKLIQIISTKKINRSFLYNPDSNFLDHFRHFRFRWWLWDNLSLLLAWLFFAKSLIVAEKKHTG